MRKLLHTLFTLTLVLFFAEAKAQITIGTVDPGPYTPESSIAATFTLGPACIPIGNTFNLYLSDATGSFATKTLIGSYAGFYSTFVNGKIPAGTAPGTGYKIRVESTTTGITFTESTAFTIAAGPAVTASVTSLPISSSSPETYGFCENRATNNTLNITNESTATGDVNAYITNELTGGAATQIHFDTPIKQFTPQAAHYTMLAKVIMPNGNIATKAYFIINSKTNTAFSTSGSGLVCLPQGTLTYGVTTETDNGIQNNFPGNIYVVNWGDGTTNSTYTLCDLKTAIVQHQYTTSSCGKNYNNGSQTYYNVFGVNISTESPFCGQVGKPLSTYAKVITVTENKFTGPAAACTNSQVTFTNTSVPGQNPDASSTSCTDNNVTYNWYINGQLTGANYPKSRLFTPPPFTTPGVYEIKLESVSSGECQGPPFISTICIQNPPQPAFDFGGAPTTSCAPYTIQAVDKSVIDNNCNNANTYNWIVTPSAGVTFDHTAKNPTFNFTIPGTYSIILQISTASCGMVSTPEPQKVILIDGTPTATLSGPAKLCQLTTLKFDPTAGSITRTVFTGTQLDLPDTYTWSVTESDGTPMAATDYSFDAGTGPNTKYPSIKFNTFKTYKVSVTHKNSCGSFTSSQLITFTEAPVPTITVNPSTCYNTPFNLTGAITNDANTTFSWSSTGGGVFSNPASLTTTYTPTAAENAAGTTTITLLVNTGIPGDCAQVRATAVVAILPNNTGINAAQSICTGNTTAYTPVSSVTESTFTWTAANADGFATGYTPSGSGPINETITNTSATTNAVVVYTITPSANGCTGVPFTFTVTVTPRPVLIATPAAATICSNQPAAIALSSNLGTSTQYTWTSVATGVTGSTNNATPVATATINDVLVNNNTGQGSVTYTITPISSTGCPGTPVTVTVLVDPAVTVANAGPDESICDLTSYTLKGNQPTVGTGMWTVTSGQTITIANPTLYNTAITDLVGGQAYTLRWTISAPGACNPTFDEVVITVNIPTVAGTTGNAATVCQAANAGNITLTGNTGLVLRWESSTDGGITWVPIANTTTTLSYTNITATTQYRAAVQNGSCDIKFSTTTTITVTPATTVAAAGADQGLCAQTTTALDANLPNNGDTGQWTLTSGPPTVTITDPANPKTTVTGLVPGQNYTFTWTITGASPCGPTMDDVVITDHPPLTNTISSTSTVVCYGQTVNITGDTPTGGDGTYSYTWEVSTDGTNWSILPGQNAKDLAQQLLTTSSFRRTVVSSTCTLVSNIIQITVQPPITNNTIAADQTICTGLIPAPLTGSTPAGSDGNFNFQWQLSEDNGTTWTDISGAVFQAYAPPALTTTSKFRRIVSTITCNGDQRNISTPVTITVNPNAKAEYTFTKDKDCTPFVIDANNIKAVPYPDRNSTYTWYADNIEIGTTITFPGYTISASNQSVTIKLVTLPALGCQPGEFSHVFSTNQSVAASYTQTATEGCGPLVVNFVNTSTSLTNATFRWDFGNGTTSSQTMPAPVTFLPDPTGKDTTYTVTLTATTTCGTNSITSTVLVKAKPISVFSPSKTTGCSPMTVTFSNTSPGGSNTYYYDFGDGTLLTKTDKSSVQHTYTTSVVKDFVVTMIAENECGRDQSSYTIRVSPNTVLPELVVNADQKQGCAPFSVNFYNNSKGGNLFKYDFGDGATLLTRSAPEVVVHTFTAPGTYTITLTASNGCSDTTTTESVTVLEQPLTAFSADITLGCPGLPVQFRNTSVGGVSYLWDFGDGTTSNEFEPKHIFNGDQEYYTISLTATNSLGCTATTIMNQYIHVVQPPVAQFNVAPSTLISIPNYTFRFEDESTNNPTLWAWDFGDGKTSILQNPSHTYLDTGKYVVTLRVTNQQGCFTTTFKTVTIVGVPGYLYVPNSFMPGSQTPELRVFRAKGSGIKTWRMSIFNKWGQQLWETTQLNEGRPVEGWDGVFNSVPVPQGVYFWKIDVEFVNGTAWKGMTYDSSAPKKTGVIHLLR